MADKKLNEVTKVTDMAYVPVIMSDGSLGQIAKADLASVVAGIIGTGIAQNITINPGESNVVYLDGAYYIKAEGQGIMNGILLVRTRYSLNILAKSSNAGYDKLVVEQNGAHDTTLTNTADVVQTITIKRL